MAQTPISTSVIYNSRTPTNIYTVPSARTAVVKSVLASSLITTYDTVTINKVSGGVTYPIVQNRTTGYPSVSSTYTAYPPKESVNLLDSPITLVAGESLSISTTTSAQYKFITSVNGTTHPNLRVNNIHYLNSTYIAVGFDATNGNGLVITSTDAITWTKQNFPFGLTITDIAFDGTNYVVVGRGSVGFLYYSTNLTSWTQVAAPNTSDMNCITFGNSRFVAGGTSGVIWYATTPTSWSTATTPIAADINAVLTIGTNWAFGSTGAYCYTSNFTTFTAPYFFKPITASVASGINGFAMDSAGKMYIGNTSTSPNASATTAIWSSTDLGKTFTAYDLSGLSGRPTNSVFPHAFGNGGKVFWMFTHPATSPYLSSSDGVSINSQSFTGTYATSSSNWYTINGTGGIGSTYNYMMSYLTGGTASTYGALQIGTVASNGVYTDTLSFLLANAQIIAPNQYGHGAMAASPSTGTWIFAATFQNDTNYGAWLRGTSASNGAVGQGMAYAWYIPSLGSVYSACHRPNHAGFIMGTNSGYLMTIETPTSTETVERGRPFPDNGVVCAITPSGTTSQSKILAISAGGYIASSTDQGVTWTYVSRISASFSPFTYVGGNKSLQYSNGYWMAFDSSGGVYYSTDGLTWLGNPLNIGNMYTLNSNNIFIKANTGITYTAGTSPDVFVNATTQNLGDHVSVRRMAYVNGSYLIGGAGVIYSSTDLLTWTGLSIANKQINNSTFYSPNNCTAIVYTGAGNNIVVGNALRATTSATDFSISQPTLLSASLVTGAATAGIVEIS
jgi:hypothetical protein